MCRCQSRFVWRHLFGPKAGGFPILSLFLLAPTLQREQPDGTDIISFPFLWPWFRCCIIRCWWFGRRAKGGQRGRRHGTDVNCDDSWSFLPLTSSTLVGGGESVATERNLKDGEGFHHCHKHGLVRGMWVHERALWTVHFIHTYVGTLARASFLLVFRSLRSPPSFTHALMQERREGGRRPLTHLFHH